MGVSSAEFGAKLGGAGSMGGGTFDSWATPKDSHLEDPQINRLPLHSGNGHFPLEELYTQSGCEVLKWPDGNNDGAPRRLENRSPDER